MPRAARPVQYKSFGDFWIRAGLPDTERVNAMIIWNTAIDATCDRLAQALEFDVGALQSTAAQLKADL
jgi:hypothetical protein